MDNVDSKTFNYTSDASTSDVTTVDGETNGIPEVDVAVNDEFYKMSHGGKETKRGLALVFSHYKFSNRNLKLREGTQKDCDALEETLKKLCFDVCIYKDFSKSEIETCLKKLAGSNDSQFDCLVVVVLTHGDQDKLHSYNGKYNEEKLWKPFLGNGCKWLIGKPKLFFIQACRGKKVQRMARMWARVTGTAETVDSDEVPKQVVTIPNCADLMIMHSTFAQNVAFLNPDTGSWFISSLCYELNARAQKNDLLTILTAVNRRVTTYVSKMPKTKRYDQKMQISTIQSTLTRLVTFRL